MKRLLIYNQSENFVPSFEQINRREFHIEHTLSISEVLKKYLFDSKAESAQAIPDIFLASLSDPTKDVLDFLNYVHQHRPKIKLIVVMESAKKVLLLKRLFKNKNILISEACFLQDILI